MASRVKVCFVGEYGVGKTSLISRFVEGAFPEENAGCSSPEIKELGFTLGSKIVDLQLWDAAGREKFASLTVSFYKNADVALVVFDVCDEEGLEKAGKWLEEVSQFVRGKPKKYLVGNKADLVDLRKTSEKAALDLAEKHGCEYVEMSAKSGQNVELTLTSAIKSVLGLDDSPSGSPKVARTKEKKNFLKKLLMGF